MEDYAHLIRRLADSVEETAAARFARPSSTYRLEFGAESITFARAESLASYLDSLGASHLYASPILRSRSGGSGYAIVDYGELNPALGDSQDFSRLANELHGRGMGMILDIVPNHMSAAAENRWWRDVLENGPSSPYASYFDIDWTPVNEALENKLLLPILGDQYGKVLDAGELKLGYAEGAFYVDYYAARLPLDPKTYRRILNWRLEELKAKMPADSENFLELESILTALEHLPERTETSAAPVAERQREKEVVKNRLKKLIDRSPEIAEFIVGNVAQFGGSVEDRQGFDRLDALLDDQVYRLSHWKAAADEIKYRRFFDINGLAAICMEEPKVFEESHRLIFEMLVRGDADGLRIDHIDGLFDPQEYLNRLQLEYLRGLGRTAFEKNQTRHSTAPMEEAVHTSAEMPAIDWKDLEPIFMQEMGRRFGLELPFSDPMFRDPAETVQIVVSSEVKSVKHRRLPLYTVVEKILGPEEPLPPEWPVAGTTGYDFANFVGGLFIDPTGFAELKKIYFRFVGEETDFREVAYQSKILILRVAMSSDLQLLAHRLNRLSERHRHCRDFTLNELRAALREVMACFPVYRTYIRQGMVSEQDRQFIFRAAAQAKRRNPARNPALFDFIRSALVLEMPPELNEAGILERALFVGRFQQTTSPVMAKGIEDTAFYRHIPLASLSEVGGNPTRGATLPEDFHRQNAVRQLEWPLSLICTSTHDTKRSEDVRARINVLSEIPAQWRAALNRWSRLNRRHRRELDGHSAPSRNDEYLFYQTLVGFWPLDPPDAKTLEGAIARMQQYMEKATREAKLHTSWINPVVDYDSAVRDFVASVMTNHPKNRFLAEFRAFHEQIVNWGLFAALSQTVLKLTSPGVPDIYQGQELWDFSLVDPDNRRPVDFDLRRNMLNQLEENIGHDEESLLDVAKELAVHPRDPRLKLFVTWRTLQYHRRHAELFAGGEYLPLATGGAAAKHLCVFARQWTPSGGSRVRTCVIAVPRCIAQLMKAASDVPPNSPPLGPAVWKDTFIDLKDFTGFSPISLFTGQRHEIQNARLSAAELFSAFPVAMLVDSE
jgi:(1->4)-alpha-D-glucan 1-alpha-D-glucosylmutase